MAQKQLLQLPKTKFSGLEFSNILEDVYNLVKENPTYNESWDDFLSSNAGVMITEIFAWITDQLATRIDWVANETFIGTATQRGSIINLLKLIGYKFKLPAAAEVPVEITFNDAVGEYFLTNGYNPAVPQEGFNPKTITAKDKKGNIKFFEAVSFDSVTQKYSYILPISVNTDINLINSINFYEGQTKIETFTSFTNQGQIFSLSEGPVIRNSIIVTLATEEASVKTETELLAVDNFLSLKAQQYENSDGSINQIPYVINVLEDDEVEVTFGSSSLLASQERRLTEGSIIRVFYRVGGGIDGNISRSAINLTEDITQNSIKTSINFLNKTEGVGSEDSETIEHAAYSGPLQIKTAGKTVTEEDYDIILSSFVNVLLSKAYGHNNIPSNFFDKYGIYINPLEVLNFIIMKKSGWEEIPTSKYKYANWGTFNLENYFNEKISFTDGEFGIPVRVNNNSPLTLSEEIDTYDGGREFKNFMIISTPDSWKEAVFIEDPSNPGNYISNPELKASLTLSNYNDDPTAFKLLEDINDHFVLDNEDSFFYGSYTETSKIEITQDINAYFQSKKDVSNGVFIGGSDLVPAVAKYINLNIDGHGDVQIDLSNATMNYGLVPLDGRTNPEDPVADGSVIDLINTALETAYNDVFSYQDFGILINDTSVVIPALEDLDDRPWTLRIRDINIAIDNQTDYIVNTGIDQTYENMLAHMNNTFGHGYQELEYADSWDVVGGTEYQINISIDGTPNELTLRAVVGNTLYIEDSASGAGDGLVEILNHAFEESSLEAIATILYDENVENVEESGRIIRITSKLTNTDSAILITDGASYGLLGEAGIALKGVQDDTSAGHGLIATFIQSSDNIACSDVRISQTTNVGNVELLDSGTSTDILAAYLALPVKTIPIAYGDYSNVATVVYGYSGKKYIKLEGPNTGTNASIIIKKDSQFDTGKDATIETFDLDYLVDDVNEYICLGQRKLTIIHEDTDNEDFADFIYEHGSIHFNELDEHIDPEYIYLNFISSKKDTIRLGNYYTDNFEDTDPEWKLPAYRIYNTIYEIDEENEIVNTEKINYDVSNLLIKFTKNEIDDNSIYVIDSDGTENTILPLTITEYPTITGDDVSGLGHPGTPDSGETGDEKFIKISINENTIKAPVDITGFDVDQLLEVLNTTWSEEANEYENKEIDFATLDSETGEITLTIDNKTNTGKIIIYGDDTGNLLGPEIFGTDLGVNTIIYPLGDYYLEHYIPEDPTTEEEAFGYFNMKIIPDSVNLIPDLSFYAHFVNDRRHKFLLDNVFRLHTDEDDLLESLQPYKIAGVDNSFKKPVFSTFDCVADIFISTTNPCYCQCRNNHIKIRESD